MRDLPRVALSAVMSTGVASTSSTATSARNTSLGDNSGPGFVLEPGLHRIERSTRIDGPITMRPGAMFDVQAGAELTLTGDLEAPCAMLFAGEGRVDMSHSRVLAARPEWWGARADDPGIDCRPALVSCARAHPVVQLGLGDYHVAGTWVMDQPNRRIWGIGRTTGARGTRLVLVGDAGPVMLVGSERAPPAINDYLRGVDLRFVEFARARVAPPPPDDEQGTATGLAIRHVLDCNFEGLRANEHAIGYAIRGAVRTFLRDCAAFRSLFDAPERDIFVGFDMDGRSPPISTGANASLYLIDCVARTGNRPTLRVSTGCRLRGALSDTFLVRFETTELAIGIDVDGRGAAGASPFRHVDLHIETPVLDQCSRAGLRVADLSDRALVDVSSPYVALAPSGSAAISIERCGGGISITGGQLIGTAASSARGLLLDAVSGVGVAGTKLLGFGHPIEARSARGLDLVVAINGAGAPANSGAAIVLTDCHSGYGRALITGPAGAYDVGVAADEATAAVLIETAGFDLITVKRRVTVAGRAVTGTTSTVSIGVASTR